MPFAVFKAENIRQLQRQEGLAKQQLRRRAIVIPENKKR